LQKSSRVTSGCYLSYSCLKVTIVDVVVIEKIMKKYLLSMLLVLEFSPVAGHATQLQEVRPIRQFPMLCGPAIGEMVLQTYGINRTGYNHSYLISSQSRGSAVAQYICDLIKDGRINNMQPQCRDGKGNFVRVYQGGKPSSRKATEVAFKKGTWLSSLGLIFEDHGLKTKRVRSVKTQNGKYRSDLVKNHFSGFLNELKKGRLVIFHVGFGKGVIGHYLLANGYDEKRKLIHYVNPAPATSYPAQASISYDKIKHGQPWYIGERYWTGRYLSVGRE